MSRFIVLASTAPLLIAGAITHADLTPPPAPCITHGQASMQMAAADWQAAVKVRFTDDPSQATIRVQVAADPAMADFAVVDDRSMHAPPDSCGQGSIMRFVSIIDDESQHVPVIYLSREAGARLSVYVDSRKFSEKEAAALIVAARQSDMLARAF